MRLDAAAAAAPSRSQEPRLARVTSVTSGEGAPVDGKARPLRQRPVNRGEASSLIKKAERGTLAGQLLRHNLVTPEKRTLKRIEALRASLRRGVDEDGNAVAVDSVGARIFEHLRGDRGLHGAVVEEAYGELATRLLEAASLAVTAADVVGAYLREVGGIQRSGKTPERVKAAHAVVANALYDLDDPTGPIATMLRDVRIEKRDGGLQLVAILRQTAEEAAALRAIAAVLAATGFADIDVRAERPAPPAPQPSTSKSSTRYAR